MENILKRLFRETYKNNNDIDNTVTRGLPELFKELVSDYSTIILDERIWFHYIKDDKIHESCISSLFGLGEIPYEINEWIDAFDEPYEELFFFNLLPFATEDGHTGLAFRYEEDIKEYTIHYVDYEWEEYYNVADSFELFLSKCYLRSHQYTYEVSGITYELVDVINEWLVNELKIDSQITIKDMQENIQMKSTSILDGQDGKISIDIGFNEYTDGSGYRECLKKDAKIILSILPRAQYTEALNEDECVIYKKLHNKLSKLDCISPIREFGIRLLNDFKNNSI